MTPQALKVKRALKKAGVGSAPVTTLRWWMIDSETGQRYREYGRAGTVCKLTKDQREFLILSGLTVYPAKSNYEKSIGLEDACWIVES